MDEVTVQKKQLLEILKKNRDNHRANFETALDGWQKTAIKEIGELADRARKGKLKLAFLNLPRPDDHTPDYDRVIQMLEMDITDTVVLTEHEFAQFVQDDWGWQKQWTTSNSIYMTASTIGKKK